MYTKDMTISYEFMDTYGNAIVLAINTNKKIYAYGSVYENVNRQFLNTEITKKELKKHVTYFKDFSDFKKVTGEDFEELSKNRDCDNSMKIINKMEELSKLLENENEKTKKEIKKMVNNLF